MKKNSIIINSILFLFMFYCITGCDKFLEEVPLGSSTTNNTFVTKEGYEALITSCYSNLHDVAKQRHVVLSGTDLFTQNLQANDLMNDYSSDLNSSNIYIKNYWESLYHGLQRCNTAIERVDKVEGMVESTIKIRYAEAVFLRALYHFFLVQQYGDIPYRDYEVKNAEFNIVRTPESEVYTNIISDLESIKNDLPKLSEQETGRASWEAIRHLMSEVYLTRGWDYNGKLGGTDDDFNKAAGYADEVIESMGSLVLEPAEIFFKDGNTMGGEINDDNQEVIFSFRFSSDNSFNSQMGYNSTRDGNDYHNKFMQSIGNLYGIKENGSFYGQPQGNRHQPTEYATRILHPEIPGFDKRYSAFYQNVITAEIDEEVPGGSFVYVGDTVLYFPGVEEGEAYADGTVFHSADILANNPNAMIYPPSMYDPGTLVNQYPGFIPLWKYFEPYNYEGADGKRDVFYMRLAGTYLLSAEAHLKAGNTEKAAERYSAVRARSIDISKNPLGVDPDARDASNITIEDILDERARELAAEYHRWYDLKRTKTLYERVIKYNLKANLAGNLEADATMKYYVRPIPRSELERVSNPDFIQNPGYN